MIIGGASGIGYAAADRLLQAGASNVILASRNSQKLKEAQSSLKMKAGKEQKISTYMFDIQNVQSHNSMIDDVQKLIGADNPLDGLVISSGINFDGSNWKGFNISETDWDNVMNVNLKGAFFLLRNFANYLHANNRKGNICVVSSISAHRDLLSVYQVTKNALSRIIHAYGKYLCERALFP